MLKLIFLFGVFLIFPLLIMLNVNGKSNFYIELSFFIIIFQATYIIFLSKGKDISLFKVYFVFVYIFFGIVPWLEYKFRISYWSAKLYGDEDRLLLNVIIILLSQTVFFIYKIFRKKYLQNFTKIQNYSLKQRIKINSLSFLTSCIIIILSILSVFITFYMKDFSILALLYRGLEENLIKGVSNSNLPSWASSFIGTSIRYYSIIALIYILYYIEKAYVLKTILLLATLIATFPLGIPRFAAAALYIPLILLILPSFTKSQNFSLLLLFGIVYLFPLFNQFRWYKEGREVNTNVDFSFFFEGHFDTYQSFLIAVSENFITYGNQLLGVFLFFVPRFFWTDKPIGSGAEMAKQFRLSFDNISANFYAEGYVNFGLIGCFLFGFILAVIMAKLDSKMWYIEKFLFQIDFFRPFYLILLGYLFFIMRGDLMSSISFLIAFSLPSFIVFLLLKLDQTKFRKIGKYENIN